MAEVESMPVVVKRVYEGSGPDDGVRILVDRLWPRGVSKEKAHIDHWFQEVAPSQELREWFGHQPERWEEFKRRYFAELTAHADLLNQLRSAARAGRLTLVYAAKDETHNNAVALKDYLEQK